MDYGTIKMLLLLLLLLFISNQLMIFKTTSVRLFFLTFFLVFYLSPPHIMILFFFLTVDETELDGCEFEFPSVYSRIFQALVKSGGSTQTMGVDEFVITAAEILLEQV